jgi:protease I
MKKRVAILVTDGFEQVELTGPREALEKAGATCVVIAPKRVDVQGFRHHEKGLKVPVDLELSTADPAEFDAVLLPGGVINADALRIEKKAQQFVQGIDRAGKPVLVICHGAWLLISAKLVKGHTITSWPTLEDDLRNAGADWVDREVVRDGNWVSSRKPDDLPAFNRESIRLLEESRSAYDARTEAREGLEVRS